MEIESDNLPGGDLISPRNALGYLPQTRIFCDPAFKAQITPTLRKRVHGESAIGKKATSWVSALRDNSETSSQSIGSDCKPDRH